MLQTNSSLPARTSVCQCVRRGAYANLMLAKPYFECRCRANRCADVWRSSICSAYGIVYCASRFVGAVFQSVDVIKMQSFYCYC